jgi:hypothetical protein
VSKVIIGDKATITGPAWLRQKRDAGCLASRRFRGCPAPGGGNLLEQVFVRESGVKHEWGDGHGDPQYAVKTCSSGV